MAALSKARERDTSCRARSESLVLNDHARSGRWRALTFDCGKVVSLLHPPPTPREGREPALVPTPSLAILEQVP